jgi:hypothetical protein
MWLLILGDVRHCGTRMRLDDGGPQGHAELALQQDFRLNAGQTAAFAVGDVIAR